MERLDHLRLMRPELRAIVEAARRTVRAAVPSAIEIACASTPPRSTRPMWKIARYFAGDVEVVAIGTFATHAHLFFQRGRELNDRSGLLEGDGKTLRFIRLTSPDDVARPEVKRIIREAFRLARG